MIKLFDILPELKTRPKIKKSFWFQGPDTETVRAINHLLKNYNVAGNIDNKYVKNVATKPYNTYDAIIVTRSVFPEGIVVYNPKLLQDDYLMSRVEQVPDDRWDYFMSDKFLSFFPSLFKELKTKSSLENWKGAVNTLSFLHTFDVERYPDMAAEKIHDNLLDLGIKLPDGLPNGVRLKWLLLKLQKDMKDAYPPVFKTMSNSQVLTKLYRSFTDPKNYRLMISELKSTSGELKLFKTAIKQLWRRYVKEEAKKFNNDLSHLDRSKVAELEWNFIDKYVTDLIREDKDFEKELKKYGYRG